MFQTLSDYTKEVLYITSTSVSRHTGMEMFLKGTSFHGVMLDSLFSGSSEMKMMIHDMVEEGIKSGAVQPLVRTVFAADEVEQAFRYVYQVMKGL